MNSKRHLKEKKHQSKKQDKLKQLIKQSSESENEDEHELSYYLNDKVKLMKEVLKVIKPKKIKSMAPDCMKNMDIEEINSMLLEELLGISNKRLRYIFNGQTLNEESSSTDPDQPDIISLDDISDDDLIIDLDSDDGKKKKAKKHHKVRTAEVPKRKKFKKEKPDKEFDKNKKFEDENPIGEKNLMNVLELLELQARARAIKSQLALEHINKPETVAETVKEEIKDDDDDDDSIIVESPKNIEILITSSESEDENGTSQNGTSELNESSKAPKENGTNNSINIIDQVTIKEAHNSQTQGQNDPKDKNITECQESVKLDNAENNKPDLETIENVENQQEIEPKEQNNQQISDTEKNAESDSQISGVDETVNLQNPVEDENAENEQNLEVDENNVTQSKETKDNGMSKTMKKMKRIIKSVKICEGQLSDNTEKKIEVKEISENHSSDENECIILNLEENEMDCINLD